MKRILDIMKKGEGVSCENLIEAEEYCKIANEQGLKWDNGITSYSYGQNEVVVNAFYFPHEETIKYYRNRKHRELSFKEFKKRLTEENNMSKFKIGDRVRVKSLEWYEANKGDLGFVTSCGGSAFSPRMKDYCGKIVVISGRLSLNRVTIENSCWIFSDEMLEDEVVENIEETTTINQTNIDWEQRRYELAKAAMQSFASSGKGDFISSSALVTCSIDLADEMIKQLKNS